MTTTSEEDELLDRLVAYVGALDAVDDDMQLVSYSLATARELVTQHARDVDIPTTVTNAAIIEVAADLYHRQAAHNGIATIDGGDIQPVRINRDPLIAAYAFLAPYMTGGIA